MNWNLPLLWLAPCIGLGAIGIGFLAAIAPEFASQFFGIKTSGSGLSYVRATGARDVFLGIIFLILCIRGDQHLISYACFATAIVSGSDYLITRKEGGRFFPLFHLGATFGIIIYAILLCKSAG